jgi:nucleoside triphosphate pyrophosphatase
VKLILASASPRRAQILHHAGIRFSIMQTHVAEGRKPGESARTMTRRLAQSKAHAIVRKLGNNPGRVIVIGADTTVEANGELLGKPRSLAEARRMLRKLSARTHRVITTVAAIRLPDRAEVIATESTRVRFAPVTSNEIAEYVSTGEPLDKAGAYAVQGVGGRFIEQINGCYFNVVGLPLARLYRMLISLGWRSEPQIRTRKTVRRSARNPTH